MNCIELNNINKSFGTIKALADINLNIKKSEFFGLIGPDGAGKTTLIRIITTLLIPDNGKVFINGISAFKNFKQMRKIIGYMPGKFSLYQDLSVEENLQFFATVFGTTIHENYHLIEDIYVRLEPFKNRRAGALSGGMKQKLALCCALIHKPEFLILDEPTTGVDAVSRQEFWEMLNRLKKEGITIVVSTPYMNEANQCDRVALIQKGKILQTDTPENIVASYSKKLYSLKSDKLYESYKLLEKFDKLSAVHLFGQELHLSTNNNQDTTKIVREFLDKHKIEVKISEINPIIEDCFMDLMLNDE